MWTKSSADVDRLSPWVWHENLLQRAALVRRVPAAGCVYRRAYRHVRWHVHSHMYEHVWALWLFAQGRVEVVPGPGGPD